MKNNTMVYIFNKETFECKNCEFICKTETAFRLHLKINHNEKMGKSSSVFYCVCNKKFATEEERDFHLKNHKKRGEKVMFSG